jgi:hypothetical protein
MDSRQKEALHQHANQDLEYLGQLIQELYPDSFKNIQFEQFLQILQESPLKIFEDLERLERGQGRGGSASIID